MTAIYRVTYEIQHEWTGTTTNYHDVVAECVEDARESFESNYDNEILNVQAKDTVDNVSKRSVKLYRGKRKERKRDHDNDES